MEDVEGEAEVVMAEGEGDGSLGLIFMARRCRLDSYPTSPLGKATGYDLTMRIICLVDRFFHNPLGSTRGERETVNGSRSGTPIHGGGRTSKHPTKVSLSRAQAYPTVEGEGYSLARF